VSIIVVNDTTTEIDAIHNSTVKGKESELRF
jgi:hypothetical protein